MAVDLAELQGQCQEALADAQLQKRAGQCEGRHGRAKARRRRARCRNSRRCAIRRAPSRTTRSPISTSIWRPTRPGDRRRRPRALGRDRRRGAGRSSSAICRAVGATHRDQGQVDDRRGDRAQRIPRGNGIAPVETDLGEYIIQLRDEQPSHIIAPGGPSQQGAGRGRFPRVHTDLPPDRDLTEPPALLKEARGVLRAEIPRRRCRHHRRQFPHRRNRHLDHRHQRGQWRSDPDAAQGPHRARFDREAGSDA